MAVFKLLIPLSLSPRYWDHEQEISYLACLLGLINYLSIFTKYRVHDHQIEVFCLKHRPKHIFLNRMVVEHTFNLSALGRQRQLNL